MDKQLLEARLFKFCRNNDVAAVHAEFTSGMDVNVAAFQGYTILHYAAVHESLDIVKWLLKQPSIRKDTKSSSHMTALALACIYNKNIDCILELIAAGCDLNVLKPYDQYPITLLISNKFMEWEKKKTVIEVMIKNGMDLDELEILKEFIKCYDGTKECLEVLHLFLYYNIDVNANGVDTLAFALKLGYFDICDILWDYIADFTLNSNQLLIASIKHGYRFNELIEKDLDVYEAHFFEIHDALFALCTSRDDANAIERLNYLCMCFHSHDDIDTLIDNATLCFNRLFRTSNAISKEIVIRLLHLLFNFAFESKIDLFHSFRFYKLYKLLERINLDKDEMIQMFYLYLMGTSRISYCQLYRLYKKCPKDLFETFLRVNINITTERNHLHEYNEFDCILYTDLLPLDMEDEKVPSLVKLSRNTIRKQFQPDCETMRRKDLVYFRYYNKVNKLDVPKRVKDILLLNCT